MNAFEVGVRFGVFELPKGIRPAQYALEHA